MSRTAGVEALHRIRDRVHSAGYGRTAHLYRVQKRRGSHYRSHRRLHCRLCPDRTDHRRFGAKVRSQVLAVDPVYGDRPDCVLRLWHRVVHHCLQSHIKSGAGHLRGAIPAAGVWQDPACSPTYQSADPLCKINLKRHKKTQGAKYTLRFLLSYTA